MTASARPPLRANIRPLAELRDMVNATSYSLDAICDLLNAGQSELVQVGQLHVLLKTLNEALLHVDSDLNDMRL